MENPEELRFKCIRCGNCCTDKNTFVNITYQDILKIRNELKLSLDEIIEIIGFYIFKENPTKENLKKMVISPIESEKGLAFVGLRKNATGSCYFYDEKYKKCKIYDLRPMFCRTFPFSFKIIYNKNDKEKSEIQINYTEKGKKYCSGIGPDMPLIDESELIKIGRRTIEELNDNYHLLKKWNDAVKKGKITPTARNFIINILNLEQKDEKF